MSNETTVWIATAVLALVLVPWGAMAIGLRGERRLARRWLRENERAEAEASIRKWLDERDKAP